MPPPCLETVDSLEPLRIRDDFDDADPSCRWRSRLWRPHYKRRKTETIRSAVLHGTGTTRAASVGPAVHGLARDGGGAVVDVEQVVDVDEMSLDGGLGHDKFAFDGCRHRCRATTVLHAAYRAPPRRSQP